MKTREEYIDAVKVKIEEISPFDEPGSFIVAGGDADYQNVKPIISYIDKSLDEAARNCLRALPLSLLHADVEAVTPAINIGADGVGVFSISPSTRFVRFCHPELQRDITAFITSEDPLYLLQQNRHTRGGQCKPVAVVSSDTGQMEIYSLDPSSAARTDSTQGRLLKINLDKKPGVRSDYPTPNTDPQAYQYTADEMVKSPIEEYIVLECAAMVFEIMENADGATVCRNEIQSKLQSVLQ